MLSRTSLALVAVAAAALLVADTAEAVDFAETHLNEIPASATDYANQRLEELGSPAGLTRPERRERRLLVRLSRRLGRAARRLRNDIAELRLAAVWQKRLGQEAGAGLQPALDEGLALTRVALGERRELLGDYLPFATGRRVLKFIDRDIKRYDATRAAAAGAPTPVAAGRYYLQAERFLTRALVRASRTAVRNTPGLDIPPRLRSGDEIGIRGARVAIPLDSGSPLAGASVLIPSGVLPVPTVITIGAGTDFVTGRDEIAGPSVAVGPAGIALSGDVTVTVPVRLPDGAPPTEVALFRKADASATLDVQFLDNDLLAGPAGEFGEFQAGVLAPPEGAPSGNYRLELLTIVHQLDTQNRDLSSERVGLLEQDFRFQADGSGAGGSSGGGPVAIRQVSGAAPHHLDIFQPNSPGQIASFGWTAIEPGRFTLTFQLGLDVAQAEGVVSTDGNLIAFTGRGGATDFFGIGVRQASDVTIDDLDGRWLAVEVGAEMRDFQVEPFSTRYFSAFTSFEASPGDGELTFSAAGTVFHSDRTFNTDQASPVHTRTLGSSADGGVEDYSVLFDGEVRGDSFRRRGFLNPDAGVFVSGHRDSSAQSVSLMLAVRQPAGGAPDPEGTFDLVRLDLAAIVGEPATTSSTLDIDPAAGSLTVDASGDATLSIAPYSRAVYSLSGTPPLGDVNWSSTQTLSAQSPADELFTLTLDADGNDTNQAERWYGLSGDGNLLLGATPGESTRGIRGILVGVR